METTTTKQNKKYPWKELGEFYEKLAIKVVELTMCLHVYMIGLEVMSEMQRIKTCDRVSGYYRLRGNKLRWINGYWRKKRKRL